MREREKIAQNHFIYLNCICAHKIWLAVVVVVVAVAAVVVIIVVSAQARVLIALLRLFNCMRPE